MPIQIPTATGKPFRPSNGTEAELFIAQFCEKCIHDTLPDGPFCEILSNTMVYEIDDVKYPKEWVYDKDGRPKCTKFEEER